MTVNAEQIGSGGKEERLGGGGGVEVGRRQMAELAPCQPYRDMTTQGNPLHLTPPLHTCCCVCLHPEGETPAIHSVRRFPQTWIPSDFFFWVGGAVGCGGLHL